MMPTDKSHWLEKVKSAQNNQELSNIYDHWSQEYDESVLSFGYNPPAVISGLVGRFIQSTDANILDAGVGTGMVGELLSILGYTNLVGIDLSLGMLERARKKQVYQDLRQMVLGQPLDFTDNAFDAVVSAGTFSANHAPPESFDEFMRIVKPQGFIIVAIRVDVAAYIDTIRAKINTLEKEGWCQLVEHSKPFKNIPLVSETAIIEAFVYRVLRG
ncbi:MAG: class I SAM-dependent methyltransferase [Symploca sp. SIO3C6]|uniref:Class I SAM-dependent methyltransferase n=1 Tax=Symploca sp. SIO1C4 TaxID=2607765 RepID=A0A6B3NGK1_9CYAN|nr:class I SAM-dependent methyltransferase [Symploca sp. SIO3C6]NER28761.1 class I SAM-dependent methyltransferase [Symploca sp. SIO1C4]